MEQFGHITAVHRLILPTVRQSGLNVTYREIVPYAPLRNIIYFYWELKTNVRLEEQFKYRVVSDRRIDIFFELNSPQENCVMGFCKKLTEFPLDISFHYMGIDVVTYSGPEN